MEQFFAGDLPGAQKKPDSHETRVFSRFLNTTVCIYMKLAVEKHHFKEITLSYLTLDSRWFKGPLTS